MNYQIVFQGEERNIETIGWNGPLTETRNLARKLAVLLDSDLFRITDLTSGKDVCFEQRPFVDPADR
jgi:hypothetical protein